MARFAAAVPARALAAALPLALAVSGGACGPTTAASAPATTPAEARAVAAPVAASVDDDFRRAADRLYRGALDLIPTSAFGGSIAVSLGYHEYDGRLPDLTPAGRARTVAFHEEAARTLERFDPRQLSDGNRRDREALLRAAKSRLFDLTVRKQPERNPMFYGGAVDVLDYVSRDYAPLVERAHAVAMVAAGAEAIFAAGREGLAPSLPRSFVETALIQASGQIGFLGKDVPAAFAALPPDERTKLDAALHKMVAAWSAWKEFLDGKKATATDEFALGEASFLQMLSEQEGIDTDVATLLRLGEADLARNRAALDAVAREIDPKATTAEVMRRLADDKPSPSGVLALATEQAATLRQFVTEHHVAEIPSPELATVADAPPFMRINTAFLRSAGVFEKVPLPSFYMISPPDPTWAAPLQRAYLPTRDGLFFVTAHEVWPGHFLHRLYRAHYPSDPLKAASIYTTSEGWAHYVEEMMWDEGAAGREPRAHAAMLREALIRDVRYLSAIGLHCRGMTVAASEKRFAEEAFADPKTAHQQAVRGTLDPGYLAYTLGKITIRKLRDDWRAKHPAAPLGAFHTAFLQHAYSTLPSVRRELIGDDSPAL